MSIPFYLFCFLFFLARERAELNKSCNLIGFGTGGICSYGPSQQVESVVLIYFRERIYEWLVDGA